MTIFEVMGRQLTKMNITFSEGNGVPNTVLELFPQTNPYHLTQTRKTGFGGMFSPISVVLLGRLFPKTIKFIRGWTRTNHVNFIKNRFKTATCINILTLRICNQGPPKRKT